MSTRSQTIKNFTKRVMEFEAYEENFEPLKNPPDVKVTNGIKPYWECKEFAIPNFFTYKNKEAVIMDGFEFDGIKFQLKASPNGNLDNRKRQFHVALKLDNDQDERLKTENYLFETRETIINALNKNYILENSKSFKVYDFKQQEWGSLTATHDELRDNGFVSNDGTDTVTVRLYARRENLALQCQDKDNYIAVLKEELRKYGPLVEKGVNEERK